MINKVFLLLVFAFPPAFSLGQDTLITAAQVTAYGIFTSTSQGRRKGYSDNAPPADGVDNIRFIEITNQIPAVDGLQFGMQYLVNTDRKGKPLNVTAVIKFPEPGLIQPGGRTYKESRETQKIVIGEETHYGYGFDEAWEKVPGEWVFEIWYKKARLIRQRFVVTLPGNP